MLFLDSIPSFCCYFASPRHSSMPLSSAPEGKLATSCGKEHRYCRLTASNFSAAVKRHSPFAPLVTRLLSLTPFRSSAVDWGRQNEAVARKEYAVKTHHVNISELGLHLMANGFIGASPDGVLHDPSMLLGSQQGLLEIKYPYSARHYTPLDACTSLENFCQLSDTGDIRLKRNHSYHFQVQGSMAVLGVTWCDFVVWTPLKFEIERITFDENLWKTSMFPRLDHFYRCVE